MRGSIHRSMQTKNISPMDSVEYPLLCAILSYPLYCGCKDFLPDILLISEKIKHQKFNFFIVQEIEICVTIEYVRDRQKG